MDVSVMPTRSFDVTAFLELPQNVRFSVRILAIGAFLATAEGLDQYIVATTLPALAIAFHVRPSEFAIVFVLQALGQALGAYGVAPLADRIGRRPLILICTFAFGALTVLVVYSTDLHQFEAARVFSFIFLGGALPNLFAIAGEFASRRNRQRYV